eukprot:TRINITY_DN5463_c0_g1_i2.p1 TRINITY_DN5463_c0_g1~~TRINITY_DN5463_c0_g1_i2.p1  ORF type:complete len:106 (-),score=18.77 TRINITY_DN5463_c0_g1_i2:269-586(-)
MLIFPRESLQERLAWEKTTHAYLQKLDKSKPVIWCGDFNVAHTEKDLKNPKTNHKHSGFTPQERESFDNFLKMGYVDTYRHFNQNETNCYTYWSYRGNCRGKGVG